ncbi:MAG TPA: DMT family transporter [candidate division Zixibacteria bacterium]|nr:DMT family transporter [candidate division Zixibacteria bacterium]
MSEFFASHFGEIASLGAAFMWACASLVFTLASRELGAGNLNRLRLVLATCILALIITVSYGWDWLGAVSGGDFAILAVSGIIGLAIGDRLYFTALSEMGPRLSTQVFALNPVSSIFLAWVILDETLKLGSIIGIVIAIAGVLIVTGERKQRGQGYHPTPKGIVYALIATLFHSTAFVIAKIVMIERIDPLFASFIRMISAMTFIWIFAAFSGKFLSTLKSAATLRKTALAVSGAVLGPSLGVWIALVGIKNAPVGIASTLLSMTPLFVIPLVMLLHGERVSARGVAGALVAFAGVTLIFAF